MNVIFRNKTRAAWVLQQMKDYIKLYGVVTVRDLKQLYGETWTIKDNLYGWFSLESASIVETVYDHVLDIKEYVLYLPRSIPLSGVV